METYKAFEWNMTSIWNSSIWASLFLHSIHQPGEILGCWLWWCWCFYMVLSCNHPWYTVCCFNNFLILRAGFPNAVIIGLKKQQQHINCLTYGRQGAHLGGGGQIDQWLPHELPITTPPSHHPTTLIGTVSPLLRPVLFVFGDGKLLAVHPLQCTAFRQLLRALRSPPEAAIKINFTFWKPNACLAVGPAVTEN